MPHLCAQSETFSSILLFARLPCSNPYLACLLCSADALFYIVNNLLVNVLVKPRGNPREAESPQETTPAESQHTIGSKGLQSDENEAGDSISIPKSAEKPNLELVEYLLAALLGEAGEASSTSEDFEAPPPHRDRSYTSYDEHD